METTNWFASVQRAEPDALYGIQEEYLKDSRPDKTNLSIGVYRDQNGQPFVPPSVLRAEQIVLSKNMHKEYAPIEGLASFRECAAKLIFGAQSDICLQQRHATVQAVGGTGSLRVGAMFLKKFLSQSHTVYIPEETWITHNQVFGDSGFQIDHYRYWDSKTMSFGFDAMMEDMRQMPAFSIVVLHSVAHNPTGIDPTLEQWQQIIDLMKSRNLFPFFDSAYQGFASGSVEEDGKVVDLFAQHIKQFVIAVTFSKNMGLYGERIASLSVICQTSDQAIDVLSQLKRFIRPIYSHPPNHGARIVTQILRDDNLKNEWFKDVKDMETRITAMRYLLVKQLTDLSTDKSFWRFIDRQRGMYCFTGLNEEQVSRLRKEFGIYAATNGRINIAAINENNVKAIAEAMHCVKFC